MGQEAVQMIIQSLLARRKEKQDVLDREESKRKTDIQKQAEDERLALQQEQLQQQEKQFNATNDLARAAHKIHILQQQQGLAQNIEEGTPVPGEKEIGRRKVGEDEYITHELPLQDESGKPIQIELPSQETYAKMQAKKNLAVKLPEIEASSAARSREAAESHGFKMEEIGATKTADFAKQEQAKLDDAEKARLHEVAENARNDATNKARISVAQINHATGVADFDPEPWINGITNGDYTLDDVKKSLPKPQATAILNSAAGSNIRPINKDQQDFMSNMKTTSDAIRLVDEFLQQMPETTTKGGALLSGIANTMSSDVTNLENEMTGRASIIARVISKERGALANKDVERAVKGYLPSRFDTKSSAIKKRDDFIKDIKSTVEAKLSTLSPIQKTLIIKKYGLDKLDKPYNQIGPTVSTPDDVFKQFGIAPGGTR